MQENEIQWYKARLMESVDNLHSDRDIMLVYRFVQGLTQGQEVESHGGE